MINEIEAQTRRMLTAAVSLQDVITFLPFHSRVERYHAVMSIGWVESRYLATVQQGANEQLEHLARSPWQFERGTMQSRGGVYGVMLHSQCQSIIPGLYAVFSTGKHDQLSNPNVSLDTKVDLLHERMAYSLHLGAAMACMLLWTHPAPLPHPRDPNYAEKLYNIYLDCWRPGKPQDISVLREGIHETYRSGIARRAEAIGVNDATLGWIDEIF